jgi:hypothetical protein
MRKLFSIRRVEGVDHELGAHASQGGGVAVPASQRAGFGFQVAVDRFGRARQLDEPVAFDRGVARHRVLGLGALFVDTAKRAPGPVVAVLVVDDPVGNSPGLLGGGRRLRLAEHVPVGTSRPGWVSRHRRITSGRWVIRVPRMNDKPAAWIALWLASEIMPASATVTSVSWWAALKALITGSIVAVSALLPSNAATINGNPVASVSRPIVICGSKRGSLENPRWRDPSAASVSKYRVLTSWSTSDAERSLASSAHARASDCRHEGWA